MPTAPYGFIKPARRAYQMQTANYWFTLGMPRQETHLGRCEASESDG